MATFWRLAGLGSDEETGSWDAGEGERGFMVTTLILAGPTR